VSKVHCGSAFEPGASGLPYYCTPPVCVPAVIGGLAVWRHNNKKKKKSQTWTMQGTRAGVYLDQIRPHNRCEHACTVPVSLNKRPPPSSLDPCTFCVCYLTTCPSIFLQRVHIFPASCTRIHMFYVLVLLCCREAAFSHYQQTNKQSGTRRLSGKPQQSGPKRP